jgi:hypothetical protein
MEVSIFGSAESLALQVIQQRERLLTKARLLGGDLEADSPVQHLSEAALAFWGRVRPQDLRGLSEDRPLASGVSCSLQNGCLLHESHIELPSPR